MKLIDLICNPVVISECFHDEYETPRKVDRLVPMRPRHGRSLYSDSGRCSATAHFMCGTDWSCYLTAGRRPWETLGFLGASCCRPGQVNRLCWSWSCLSLWKLLEFLLRLSWVWLPNLRQPRVSHFSGRTNSEIPEHRLCEVGPLAQQYTQHVVRDTYWRLQVHSLGMPGTGTAKPLWILFSSLCVVIVEEDPILLMSAVRGSRGLGSPGGLMQPDIFWPCFYTLNGDVED